MTVVKFRTPIIGILIHQWGEGGYFWLSKREGVVRLSIVSATQSYIRCGGKKHTCRASRSHLGTWSPPVLFLLISSSVVTWGVCNVRLFNLASIGPFVSTVQREL